MCVGVLYSKLYMKYSRKVSLKLIWLVSVSHINMKYIKKQVSTKSHKEIKNFEISLVSLEK